MIRRVALSLVAALACCVGVAQACSETSVKLRGDFGQVRFNVEIADDRQERAQGLMFREVLPKSSGMLFLYDRPQALSFWMRNTLIPLDLLFIDTTGVVRHIHHEAQPLDETPIPGSGREIAVLEINGGMAKALGIAVGAEVQHRFFADRDPVWPC